MTAIISSSRGMPHLSLMEFARMPNWTMMVGVPPLHGDNRAVGRGLDADLKLVHIPRSSRTMYTARQ